MDLALVVKLNPPFCNGLVGKASTPVQLTRKTWTDVQDLASFTLSGKSGRNGR